MVRSLDGTDCALLDSGSGLTSCPLSCVEDLSSLPRPDKLPTLSNATGGCVECIGLRRVGCLENGEPWVVTWRVPSVTNLMISTESVITANIEVRLETCGSSLIMNRSDTRTSVVLYKFAKEPWVKLRRDDSVTGTGL